MKRHVPNFLTCCNLFCGCLGIVFLMEDRGIPAAYFVWAACVFDFLDGFAARVLKTTSAIGKELDSLADVVSFGVLPALVMYSVIAESTSSEIVPLIGFSIAIFSALRLAVFNVDETQSDSFKGLNTPANTIFITSLPLVREEFGDWLYQPSILIIITLVFSLLLVSRIEFFAFKFKNYSWADNRIRFIFLLLSALLLALFQVTGIPFIIIMYILFSFGVRVYSGPSNS